MAFAILVDFLKLGNGSRSHSKKYKLIGVISQSRPPMASNEPHTHSASLTSSDSQVVYALSERLIAKGRETSCLKEKVERNRRHGLVWASGKFNREEE